MFTDVSPSAPWRARRVTHEEYVKSGVPLSPWFNVPGLRLELFFWDLMHIGPLGIFRSLTAGVIWDMCQRGELRNLNDELALRLLWQEFRDWCRGLKIPPPRGTLSKRLLGSREVKLTEYFVMRARGRYPLSSAADIYAPRQAGCSRRGSGPRPPGLGPPPSIFGAISGRCVILPCKHGKFMHRAKMAPKMLGGGPSPGGLGPEPDRGHPSWCGA